MNSEKEKLLKDTYDKFMKVSMNKLPVKLLDGITAENIMAYGTAIDEKLLSIQDCRDLVERQLKQSSGLKFKHERIPETTIISPEEDSAIFVEEVNLNIKSNKDTHRLFLRITTALEYSDNKWKVVHFHTSKPDNTMGETDTWHIDEWKRKNEELQKLVDEKTTDLVIKNRDLEIEASLERVRTIAMGMRRSEDLLGVCEILFGELRKLGFGELRNTMINIHNDEEETFINYDYSDTLGKTITPLFYNINPVIAKQIRQIRKGKDAFSETSFKGNELKEWKKFRKRKGEPDDPRLKNTKALYYYFYSIGTGSIGISTFGSVTKEKLKLLKRFRNVFEFAYRRYMDVTQAEAQANEAKLEASLERVRAQAMGINKSEQLGNISETVFTELKSLGFTDLRNAETIINSDTKESVISYYYSDYGVTETIEIFYNNHPKVKKWAEEMQKADDAFTSVEFGEDEIVAWRKYREEIGYLPDPKLNKAKAVYYYSYSIGPGALSISTFKRINDEQLKILERFKNVFGLAYRRYADVALAEAQTNEAKIEIALERIRSRTMAMQKSEELSDTAQILFQQFKEFGDEPIQITIGIINEEKGLIEFRLTDWRGSGAKIESSHIASIEEPILMKIMYSAWKEQKKSTVIKLSGRELQKWVKYRSSMSGVKDNEDYTKSSRVLSAAFFSKGLISISSYATISSDTIKLLERFAGVFDLTYTRFLDLKLAEEQTKEARIELALERVRARSMAMHHSSELVDASVVLFEELKSLGIEAIRTGVAIVNSSDHSLEIWSSQLIENQRSKILGVIPFTSHPFFEAYYESWKKKEPYFCNEIAGKEVKKYYKAMSSLLSYPEKKEFNPKEFFYTFFFPEGSLNVVSKNNLSEEECSLMTRFARAFGLIYRRFLDLQKSEAQTREAQIELALERVRARTMAMQRSDELEETSQLLFQQFKELGEHPERITIGTINEDERQIELWVTVEGDKNRMVKVSIDETEVFKKIYLAWKEQKKSILIDLTGKKLSDYLAYRTSFGNTQGNSDFLKDRMIAYVAFFSKGIISISTSELRPRESIQLLERFAGVFDLTYTRFLDLQKAEEQAREAQIEVALERVRSRTMAMHKSDELAETAAVLFEQLCGLGIDALRLYIGIIEDESGEIDFWTTDYVGSQISSKYKASLYGSVTFRKIYSGWKKKRKSLVVDPKGKELTEHLYYLKEIMNYPIRDKKTLSRRLQTIAYFSKGLIGVLSNEELQQESVILLERFAGVFDLTYRRFLDLQKAEAQTREAQIEVALERVRSRTMAMHSSDELQEAAVLLFQQIRDLGVKTGSCGYIIWGNEKKDATAWMSSPEGSMQEPFNLPHTKSKIYKEIYSAKESEKDFFVMEVRGKELRRHFDYLSTVPGIGEKIKELRNDHYKFPETIVYNVAFFKQGYLSFHTHELSPEAHDIFRRFANVFEQTYTRFLDLQKAEAQAREAKIEVALERVRSRTMAMHSSEDVGETVVTMFDELTKLGIKPFRCGIGIFNQEKQLEAWAARTDSKGKTVIIIGKLDMTKHPLLQGAYDGWRKGESFFKYELAGKDVFKYFKVINKLPEYPINYDIKKLPKRILHHDFYFPEGTLFAFTLEPLSDEAINIFKRFASVFGQTYRRFLDLKKAEAQTREAQIQLALERVRAKAMAMQKSDELLEVSLELYNQFKQLDSTVRGLTINIINDKEKVFEVSFGMFNRSFKLRIDEKIVMSKAYKCWKSGKKSLVLELERKDIIKFNKIRNTAVGSEIFPLEYKSGFKLIMYMAFFSNGMLIVGMEEHRPEETIDILQRFASVFDLTYTRFLDLQKAEAQAREAQIEASLEKIRSRSLAMYNAEELGEVITVVVEKLRELDFSVDDGVALITHIEGSKDLIEWMINPGFPSAIKFYLPYFEHPVLSNLWKAKNEGAEFVAARYTARENKSFLNHIFKHSDFKHTPQPIKDYCLAANSYATSIAFQKNTAIFINDYSGKTLTQQEIDILKRFSKVFEQAYIRFLDLQKAEAQAREAQIETALERVRSRTMGMQKSEELKDVIQVVYEQFVHLNINIEHTGFDLDYKTRDDHYIWLADKLGTPSQVTIPYFDCVYYNLFKEAKEKGMDFFAVNLTFKEKNRFYQKLFKHVPGLTEKSKEFLLNCPGLAASTVLLENVSLYIENFSGTPYTDEENSILMRFGKVFQQTYTRFLDLEKAEAQAREAQIETGLERVRSRAMAMHKTDELLDAAELVYKELSVLGITVMNVSYAFLDKDEKHASYYSLNPLDGKIPPFPFVFPHRETNVMRTILSSWKKQESFNLIELDEKATLKHQTWVGEHIQNLITKNKFGIPFSIEAFLALSPKKAVIYTFNFTKGYLFIIRGESLTRMQEEILLRFTKVFEQAYIRFLDLQKAEAQAREAQIEAALERTRTQSMLMQHSGELDVTSRVFHEQLLLLGIASEISFVWLPDVEKGKHLFWTTWVETKNDSTNLQSKSVTYDLDKAEPYTAECFRAWESGEPLHIYTVEASEVKAYFNAWGELFGDAEKIKPEYFPKGLYYAEAFMKYGCFGFIISRQLTEDEKKILLRFTIEFERTYTRFLDLQKAEAQAREAQIETALEKVRSQTMGMQTSEDLSKVAAAMFDQIRMLGGELFSCGIVLCDENKNEVDQWLSAPDIGMMPPFFVPKNLDFIHQYRYDQWKAGVELFSIEIPENKIAQHFELLFALPSLKNILDSVAAQGLSLPEVPKWEIDYGASFKYGYILISALQPFNEAHIFPRFATVFEQTYTRFLDLQKAEAQAREAQIQLSLERVRARAMAMQKSDELSELVDTVFKELTKLDFALTWCIINIIDEGSMSNTVWAANPDINKAPESYHMLFEDYPFHYAMMKGWKERKAKSVYILEGSEKEIYDDYLFNETEFKRTPEAAQAASRAMEKYVVSFSFSNFGGLQTVGDVPLSDANLDILSRFGKVFDLTYTRFNDLKQTEAQAREAKIEAALERVRGKAMAMHNSDDLTEAAGQVFTEFNNLGIKPIRSGFVLLSKDNRNAKLYPATSFDNKNIISFTGEFEFTGHIVYEKQYESWQKKENYFPVMEGDLLKSYYKILAEGLSVPYENFPTEKKQFGTFLPFSEGFLFTWSDDSYSENEINILNRFKNILDLTIRRYIDLKNAEAQSRESQIEASLERVRSKAMAMQKSDDLALAVSTIFEELDKLDLGTFRCGIGIINKGKKSADVWASAITDREKIVQVSGDESMDSHPLLQGAFDAWLKQEDFSYLLQGEDLINYYQVQAESNLKVPESRSALPVDAEHKQYYHVAVFQSGGLFAFRDSEFPEEAKIVIKRFADVINFTYTRFNDLKQAEAQAKEAKIEAALERVRAGSLIMRKPEDMFDVCIVISEQLILLNVNEIRNTQTVILNEGKETYQNYEYFPDYNEKTFSEIDYNLHPKVTEFVNEIKKSSEAFFTTSFEGKELQEWRDYRKSTNQIPDAKLEAACSVHYYFYSIGPGALGISTYAQLSDEQISIFKRFRNVFELAYRRYIDIEQAEAQAREAQIEAALERVRSRTLAMQKSDELSGTAAVVFKQLINLGIEPNRLYIGIINDDSGDIEAWATDEDGTRVSKEFTLNIFANASVKIMYDGWAAKKKSIIIDMQGKELESYLHYISDYLHVPFKDGLSQNRRVQNIAYFSKGFIGMASPDPQPEETAILLERFAAVFNLTFTRFNDLQIAEKHAEQAELDLIKLQTEKKRAEEALSELRATQNQLIQSEKMASLGELTAGIAHEIQNPLNFVNNFSEVNTELIDELNDELGKGNLEDAMAIAKDIKDNEEKIKHHGKRAEGIVKGMLQHSRSSSGVKEPTNINVLADEYLRLAYHGLRAKDKSFNAKMLTEFDKSIGEINVVPQEIGRVILNLITNAFYAVSEKKKVEIKGYEPTVTVSTKKSGDNILISVKDNGNGIPQKVMDKIFQPFFTTKPTGQGTGLGLSMSYDIVKAHGGELKVETKEGEGAEFVISLNG